MCEQQKNKPHVHAELIKAWADGAIIEAFSGVYGWELCRTPTWSSEVLYRIKTPKKSPGQIACEGYYREFSPANDWDRTDTDRKRRWEAAAQAVIDSLKQK